MASKLPNYWSQEKTLNGDLTESSLEMLDFPGVLSRTSCFKTRAPAEHNDKCYCSICLRWASCMCHNCATSKIRFFSRQKQQRKLEDVKKRLNCEIKKYLKQSIEAEMAELRMAMIKLKFDIASKKSCIENLNSQNTLLSDERNRCRRTIVGLKTQCAKHDKALMKKPCTKQIVMIELQTQIAQKRLGLSLDLLQIFYVKEQILEESSADKDLFRDGIMNDWTLLSTSLEKNTIKFRSHYSICSDGGRSFSQGLKQMLKMELNPTSALFFGFSFNTLVNGVHLASLLCAIHHINNNICPCLRDILLCEKWTTDLYDTDVFKFSLTVILLCIRFGMDEFKIDVSNPFLNLITLRSKLLSYPSSKPMQPSEPTRYILSKIDAFAAKFLWAERGRSNSHSEDDWCIIQEDFCDTWEGSAFRPSSDHRHLIKNFPSSNWLLMSPKRLCKSSKYVDSFPSAAQDGVSTFFRNW